MLKVKLLAVALQLATSAEYPNEKEKKKKASIPFTDISQYSSCEKVGKFPRDLKRLRKIPSNIYITNV